MANFNKCCDHMQKSLKKLKKLSYEDLKRASKTQLTEFISSECVDCTTIRRRIFKKGWIILEMKVTSEQEPREIKFAERLNLPKITLLGSASIDGFKLFVDGKIEEMHPEGYDD